MDINKYFDELAIQLNKNGFASQRAGDYLVIYAHGKELCKATETGTIQYKKEVACDKLTKESLDCAIEVCSVVKEYMVLMCDPENKQQVKGRQVLTKYGDTILVGKINKYGAEFTTWKVNADGDPYWGNSFTDYEAAKKNFAVRSGLINKNFIFSPVQLAELHRAASTAVNTDNYFMTIDQSEALTSALAQIEEVVPNLDDMPKPISEQDIKDGIENGVVKFITDPNLGSGTVCQIGEYWFYFGDSITEEMGPEEYMNKVPMDDTVQAIVGALTAFTEQEETLTEYEYYKAILEEAKARV